MAKQKPTPENVTLVQGFEWNVPADGKHWKRLLSQMDALKGLGAINVWLPPGCKGSSQQGNGYDVYDLWDIGEFDQKGGVGTKWVLHLPFLWDDILKICRVPKTTWWFCAKRPKS